MERNRRNISERVFGVFQGFGIFGGVGSESYKYFVNRMISDHIFLLIKVKCLHCAASPASSTDSCEASVVRSTLPLMFCACLSP